MAVSSLLPQCGHACVLHRAGEKRLGGVHVPVPTEIEIHRLARLVDSAVQAHPLPVNLIVAPWMGRYLAGVECLGMFRFPLTTGGKSFTSSYTSVMNRSLLCLVSP